MESMPPKEQEIQLVFNDSETRFQRYFPIDCNKLEMIHSLFIYCFITQELQWFVYYFFLFIDNNYFF